MTYDQRAGRADEGGEYRTAHQLLSQLARVSRTLPAGLDETRLARVVLEQVAKVAPFDRAAFYSFSSLDQYVPITTIGADQLMWETLRESGGSLAGLDDHAPHVMSLPAADPGPGSRSTPMAALLPARVGSHRVGLVVIECDGNPWTPTQIESARAVVADAAIQLDAGRLFGDVRDLATIEERRRLAREIHDGVAQEIASLGYLADGIAADCPDPDTKKAIRSLRHELSRVVTELRLSIFDLRSDVEADGGLGSALSSYVRQVGTASGLTVHLLLDESGTRLGSSVETEMFRIAQEAITNVRRHSGAENLWVTCRVHPPQALLRVTDDGNGLGSARIDSYGLAIMRERAGRIGANLAVRDREGGGTMVEAVVGATGH